MNFLRVSEGVGPRQPCLGRADATAERSRATRNNPVQAQTRYRQASDNASEAGQASHSCSCHRAALARLSAVSLQVRNAGVKAKLPRGTVRGVVAHLVERGLVSQICRDLDRTSSSATGRTSLARGGRQKLVLRFRWRATDDGTAPTADQEQRLLVSQEIGRNGQGHRRGIGQQGGGEVALSQIAIGIASGAGPDEVTVHPRSALARRERKIAGSEPGTIRRPERRRRERVTSPSRPAKRKGRSGRGSAPETAAGPLFF